MVTEVLQSQAGGPQPRFRCEAPAPTTSSKSSHLNYGTRSRQQMQSPVAVQANQHDGYQSRLCNQSPGPNLVMGQVKILKRGEKSSFDRKCSAIDKAQAKSEERPDLVLESTDHRPDRNQVRVVWKVEKYAGSSIHDSPSPSLVPFPRFLGKKLQPSVT